MIQLAREVQVRAVLTLDLDRLARNAEVAHRFTRELVGAGVRWA